MAVPYSFRVEQKEGYLHIRVRGENTPEVTRRYVLEMIDACRKSTCSAVLLEENLEGPRMGAGELYSIIQELHAEFRSAIQIGALVDTHPLRSDENMRFVEDASVNRGAGVAAFATLEKAEAWIRERVKR